MQRPRVGGVEPSPPWAKGIRGGRDESCEDRSCDMGSRATPVGGIQQGRSQLQPPRPVRDPEGQREACLSSQVSAGL